MEKYFAWRLIFEKAVILIITAVVIGWIIVSIINGLR